MTRIFLLLLAALICAPAAFAQSSDKDYSFYEFYVGYAHMRAYNDADHFDRGGRATVNGNRVDLIDDRNGYNGFTAEFNQNVHRNIGIVTSFTATFDDVGYVDRLSGNTFDASVQRYDLMIGPRFNWRTRHVTPFAHALFGITHLRASFDAPLASGKRTDTGFAMALGGGLDVHAGEHLDIRPIMVDWVPSWLDSRRQDNFRAGAGIKIK